MLLHDLAEHTGEWAACPAPQPGAFHIGFMDANDTLSLAGTEAAHKQTAGPAVPRKPEITARLTESIEVALKHADNLVLIDVVGDKTILYSCNYACPDCGFSFPELTPRMFSFNNPYGACPKCSGIGYLMKMDEDLIIPDKTKTLYDGVKAFGSSTMKKGDTMAKMYFESIGKHYGVEIKSELEKGTEITIKIPRKSLAGRGL